MKINSFNYDLVRYVIPCYKLKRDVKVILIADIHGYTKNRKKSLMLGDAIKKLNPHHVIIAGDIMQGDEWDNNVVINDLKYFLDNLKEHAPIFMTLGNHDLTGNNKDNHERRISNFKKMEQDNVYPLFQEDVLYDNFQIIGFTPRVELFNKSFTMSYDLLQKHFIEEVNTKIVIDNNKYIKEFIGHDPHMIIGNDLGVLNNCDTFYSGHLHNGYLTSKRTRRNPDRYLDYGYTEHPYEIDNNGKLICINPLFLSKTNLCRGCIYFDKDIKYLELRNNHFYKNVDNKWYSIYLNDAIKYITDNKLKSLVITGGVKKFSYFSNILDIPEVTMVSYEEKEKILTK